MKLKDFTQKCIRHTKWLFDSFFSYFRFSKLINSGAYVYISHNADNAGGAPVVLFELMRTMKTERKVIFLSEKTGGIISQCKNEGIQAFAYYGFRKLYLNRIIKAGVAAVVVNTLAAHKCIRYFNKKNAKMPILWWIHEERGLVERYYSSVPRTLNENILILGVSDRVKEDFTDYFPEYKDRMEIMYYGCHDLYKKDTLYLTEKDHFIITVIGRICERKNQLQVVEAFNLLTDELKERIYIRFVSASCDSNYMQKLRSTIANNSHFSFVGPFRREEMIEVYRESDLLICSSTDDPLPVVVTEAMMLKCLFITSSKTGQYELIKNGINGYSYKVDSTGMLRNLIEEIYKKDDISSVLDNARGLYLKYFTLEQAKNRFQELLEEIEVGK